MAFRRRVVLAATAPVLLAVGLIGCGGDDDGKGLRVRTEALPDAAIGVPYQASLEAAGGKGKAAWEVVDGSLPAGLTLDASGEITGVPDATATNATFRVKVKKAGR